MEENLKDNSVLMFLMKCQTTDIFDGMEAILWRKKKTDIHT